MKKIRIEILGLSFSQSQSGAYTLVLGEYKGRRRLPIVIGSFEAQSIAIELEKMTPSRPLTHDLFKSFAKAFSVKVKEVVIYNIIEGVFYARLVCENHKGGEIEIDARTSDAVAIALRFSCPIFTYDSVLNQAGVFLGEKGLEPVEEVKTPEKNPRGKPSGDIGDLRDYTMKELNEILDKAVRDEAYERASLIRDEIKKRKGNNS
ncbi:MAG: bifunctional nuclease family protein [Bacteroidetes bacterium]|nr:bifunctional nuclease family protein [Bacteroidota bacterium]